MAAPSRTLFLHAGPPKTGSTTIQHFMHGNAAAFRRQGLLRPQTGTLRRRHYHLDLVEAFAPATPDHPLRAALAAEIEAEGRPDRVFVSAEHFASKLTDPVYLDGLIRFCGGIGYRLHVIAYVRPPAPLLNSLYTEAVKSWRPMVSIDGFLDREVRSGRHDSLAFCEALPAQAGLDLSLRPFSRAVLKNGLTADLCAVMGINLTGTVLAAGEQETNASPGPMTVAAFERLRKRTARVHPGLDRDVLAPLTWPLLRAAGSMGWNDVKFGGITPERTAAIRQHFAAGGESLARLVWGSGWNEVFTEAEQHAPPFNVFDPAAAAPAERRAFRDFMESAEEMIGNVAAAAQANTAKTSS